MWIEPAREIMRGVPIVSMQNGELTTRISTTLFVGRDYDFSDL
jgi:hypothetical protein